MLAAGCTYIPTRMHAPNTRSQQHLRPYNNRLSWVWVVLFSRCTNLLAWKVKFCCMAASLRLPRAACTAADGLSWHRSCPEARSLLPGDVNDLSDSAFGPMVVAPQRRSELMLPSFRFGRRTLQPVQTCARIIACRVRYYRYVSNLRHRAC